jgi:RimJ/RimL family protein N-acetyltransferase/nitroimidazol reductase NimA-like FMN-containing flavoprotein (pyridoxamine 5'-phosphate oxidase superfamily)
MPTYSPTPLTRVRRGAKRAHYDTETIHAILDEAPVCHIGFVQDGQPFIIPANFARQDETLYLHGSTAGRLMHVIQTGQPLCVEVTLLDGLVFGRSAPNHSMNFRSVVAFGRGRAVSDEVEKLHALELIFEHFCPRRWQEVRPPDAKELEITAVVAIQIEQASAKVRRGPAGEESAVDLALPIWGGELPLRLQALEPLPDEHTPPDRSVSPSIARQYRPNLQNVTEAYPRLETERLLLRPLSLEDAPFILKEWGDPVVTYYMRDEEPLQTLQDAYTMLQPLQTPEKMPGLKWWGIELKTEAQLIGTCGYYRWDKQHQHAEIGYDLWLDYWGQGLMPEALRVLLQYGFDKMGLHRIEATTHVENLRSMRVLEKLGFQREGILRSFYYRDGSFNDQSMFSLLKSEWAERNKN